MVHSILVFLSVFIASCAGQGATSLPTPGLATPQQQGRIFNETRIPQQDQDFQDPSQRTAGSLAIPAIPLQPGSTIYPPQQPNAQFGAYPGTYAGQPTYQVPQQHDDSQSLLKVMGSRSFMDILRPPLMSQADATKSLIPPLITDGMQKTLQQQQQGMPGQQSTAAQPTAYSPYQQQPGMMDARFTNPYQTGAGLPYGQPNYVQPQMIPQQYGAGMQMPYNQAVAYPQIQQQGLNPYGTGMIGGR